MTLLTTLKQFERAVRFWGVPQETKLHVATPNDATDDPKKSERAVRLWGVLLEVKFHVATLNAVSYTHLTLPTKA